MFCLLSLDSRFLPLHIVCVYDNVDYYFQRNRPVVIVMMNLLLLRSVNTAAWSVSDAQVKFRWEKERLLKHLLQKVHMFFLFFILKSIVMSGNYCTLIWVAPEMHNFYRMFLHLLKVFIGKCSWIVIKYCEAQYKQRKAIVSLVKTI